MTFDATALSVLEYYTLHPPPTEDQWYGPWNAILTALFPSSLGYVVTPQRRLSEDPLSHIPDLVIEVVKLTSGESKTFRTVLILKVKNTQHWNSGIPALMRQITRQTDAAFYVAAHTKVYWIAAIGPHWRYGVTTQSEDDQEDSQGPIALIDWHEVTHDEASYRDLSKLAELIAALEEQHPQPRPKPLKIDGTGDDVPT